MRNFFNLHTRFIKLIFPALLSIILSGAAFGATFTVTKTADTNDGVCNADCSLREAITVANAAMGDNVIVFSAVVFSTPQTISLGNDLFIQGTGSLLIDGPGSQMLTLDGNNFIRIFSLNGSVNVEVEGLTMAKGGGRSAFITFSGGGCIYNLNANLSVRNSVIRNCFTSSTGGGIRNGGTFRLYNTSVINNNSRTTGSDNGGAIYNDDSSIFSAENSDISNNDAGTQQGGAIYNRPNVTTTITNSTINNNTSEDGGAIYNSNGGMNVSGSTFNNNTTPSNVGSGAGGAIRNVSGMLTVSDSTFTANQSPNGGGIFNGTDAIMSVSNSNFSSNSARGGNGGGIANGGILTISNSVFVGNSAIRVDISGGSGGAISNGRTLNITDSNIESNTSSYGGGIANKNGTTSAIKTSIIRNTAAVGGGICNGCDPFDNGGAVSFTNSTISNNTANIYGGGIYHSINSPLTLVTSTISGNTAPNYAGVFSTGSVGTTALATIIADNIATQGAVADFQGTLTSQGYNLIENTNGANITGDTTGNILNRDPQLIPPGNYGGITKTVALQPTSPAIDAGDPNNFPATDQRGIVRPQDGDLNGSSLPDIGAYERQVIVYTTTKVADTNDGVCNTDCSLREALNAANSSSSPDNAFVFDPMIFSTPQTITLTLGELTLNNYRTFAIYGGGSNRLTISGNNQSRIFSLNPFSSLLIDGVKLTGGNGVGAVNSGFGGAVYNGQGFLNIVNSDIIGNTASNGGGIYSGANNNGGTLRITSSFVRNNSAENDGGGVVVTGNAGEINGSTLRENTATGNGGGIYLFGGAANFRVSNSTITNNMSGSYGGGIYLDINSSLEFSNSSNMSNTAATGGGGFYNFGRLNITSSTAALNSTQGIGGGILNESEAILNLTNSTVSTNFANVHGGGIYNVAFSSITTLYVTIAKNSTNGIGGGIFNSNNGRVNSRNTIFGDNNAVIQSPDFEGSLISQGYNLVGNTNGTAITGTTTGNILGVDPQLLPLRNYGGATQTHALKPTSPAVDKGSQSFPTTDQRGQIRLYDFPNIPNASGGNGSDIGAFERQPNDVRGTTLFDFDGDGKSDISVFRPSNGAWYIDRSTAGFTGVTFGFGSDLPVPADYDGDGKTDVAVFRPSDGSWYYLKSSDGTFVGLQWGLNGDIPIPGDFDGDGKADINVFRPSDGGWYRLNSSTGGFVGVTFGQNGDKPLLADFDGDGKNDVAVFRPSTGSFYSLDSSTGAFRGVAFGFGTDIPTMGDFDGDGKTDIAVFRPSNGSWYRLNSSNGNFFGVAFGQNGDIPVAADYDGDGKTDIGVFRNGNWYYLNSSNGAFVGLAFGFGTDKPIPAAFLQ